VFDTSPAGGRLLRNGEFSAWGKARGGACFTHKKQTAGAQNWKQTRPRLANYATSNGSSSDENWQ
jgi:hypothetical protein